MTRVAVATYDHPDNATEVIDALAHAGFDHSQIECIEPDPLAPGCFRRIFEESDPGESIDRMEAIDLLVEMGVPEEDALHYVDAVRSGKSVVAVQAEEEISGRARQIMNRFPLSESVERSTLDDEPVEPGRR